MKVLFMTNLPSPYRRLFFAELGKKCDLTVIYERKSARDRNKKWVAKKEETYNEIFLHSVKIGDDNSISFEILKHLSQKKYDVYVISTYNTFTSMIAISYLRAKKIAYYHSTDGGFISEESRIKYSIKKHFISSADKWLSTGANSTDYLCHYGAKREKVFVYPFTSLTEADIESAKGFTREDKFSLRKILGIREERVLLTVGRFSYQDGYGKGYDILLAAAERIDPQIGIYIVGDEPTDEFVRWKDERRLDNIHYVGFKEKDELTCYYVAADAFILLTRGDVWGLVINEAMSFGLPVITTYQCNAGEELIRDGENGYLIDAGDVVAAAKAIENVFSSEIGLIRMSKNAIVAVSKYSIENMSDVYMKVFTGGGGMEKDTKY